MIRRNLIILWAIAIFSCSTDSDSDLSNPGNNTIPFSVTALVKEYNGGEGEYHTIDFIQGRKEPSNLTNITNTLNLEPNAIFRSNGLENLLLFKQGDLQGPDAIYIMMDLDDNQIVSGSYKDYFPITNNCFFDAGQIGWDKNRLFSFENDVCDQGNLRLLTHNLSNSEVTEFPFLEKAFTGDTPHGILVTEDYFFVQYDDRSEEALDTYKEGLIVYNSSSLNEVFSNRTAGLKTTFVDGHDIFVATRPSKMEIIDLTTGNVKHSTTTFNYFLATDDKISNVSISDGKVAYVDNSMAIGIPAYFDFNENDSFTVDQEKYMAFFNRDTLDFDADVIVPQEFKIDLETMTFAVTYLRFSRGENVPKSSAIMFMDFEGNLLLDYEFPSFRFEAEKLLKR
ncbi:hypothetical protein [Flagellimonas sp.]|uniref:hypothetical protein n=1 Tax=Flagellimonas sp. TaxID=2058762 RepID=UPI003B5155F6